jgi:hypothetical protein
MRELAVVRGTGPRAVYHFKSAPVPDDDAPAPP